MWGNIIGCLGRYIPCETNNNALNGEYVKHFIIVLKNLILMTLLNIGIARTTFMVNIIFVLIHSSNNSQYQE